MSIKGFEKSITAIMLLGLILGSITYVVHISSTISQLKAESAESQDQFSQLKAESIEFKDQLLKTQQQLSELSDNYSQLQDQTTQGPRYTGNPFSTELWPGQLQSENITGMHWYSWNGTGLQNCTDNVLGLGGAELEGDYTSWSLVWAKDYGPGDELAIEAIDNNGLVYLCQSYADDIIIKELDGSETLITQIEPLADMLGLVWMYHYSSSITAKYVVFNSAYGGDNLTVYKDGLEIFVHDCSGDIANFSYIDYWAISSNGKYIAIVATDTVNGDVELALLYEGS